MIPANKLVQDKVTKAELGTENRKLAGYINGTDENLKIQNIYQNGFSQVR